MRPSGTLRDAAGDDLVRRLVRDLLALEDDRARFAFTRPEMARRVVDFPAPFAPTSVTMLPFSTFSEMPWSALIEP